jgi:hypothetical protein
MAKAKSSSTSIKAKLGMKDVADGTVVTSLNASYNGVLNNSAYPNSPIDLVSYKANIDKFSALVVDAEDGGKKAVSAKNKQREVVIKMYTLLGHYVEGACNGDLATFNSSGFTQAAKPVKTPPGPLTEAAFSSIDRGANSGDVVVLPLKQKGAVAFDVRYALQGVGGTLGPWTTVTTTKAKRVTISGLTMAGIYQFQTGIYQFQIRALGVLGYTDWMDTKTFVVA